MYALGAILYELLTGRPPLQAETVMETVVLVLEREPEPPSRHRPGVPRDLELICLKCLEKRPEGRFDSAAALADDLDRFLRGDPPEARRLGAAGRALLRRGAQPELASRLIGLSIVCGLTQVNYFLSLDPQIILHAAITGVEVLWAVLSIALHRPAHDPRRARWARPAWIAADMACVTALLWMMEAALSSLVVGYPLLIAASGLWTRVRWVGLATALAVGGYLILLISAEPGPNHHPNIIVAVLAITGLVVAQQVKRLRALSTYFEQHVAP